MKLKFVNDSEIAVVDKTYVSEDVELTEEQINEKAIEFGFDSDKTVLVSVTIKTTVKADPESKDQMTYYDPATFEKMYGPARIIANYHYNFSQPQ